MMVKKISIISSISYKGCRQEKKGGKQFIKEVHPTQANMSVMFVCINRRDTETQRQSSLSVLKIAMDGWHGMALHGMMA